MKGTSIPPLTVILCSVLAWGGQPTDVLGTPENAPPPDQVLTDPGVLNAANRAVTFHTLSSTEGELRYTATAASITVADKHGNPTSRMFYIAYTVPQQRRESRPLTFVFNGGPGAASAYLHLGALGPQRIVFNDDGTVPSMPARLTENPQSFLRLTDLVFVDPVGTGYSRELKPDDSAKNNSQRDEHPPGEAPTTPRAKAWGVEEDTESLARFIRTYLTQENRWLSPLYLAGESYGGFRVARLSKALQATYGIAPTGLMLISPALDFSLLWGDERSLWPWAALLPSYAAVAGIHGKSLGGDQEMEHPRTALADVEQFALSEFLAGLAAGQFEAVWLNRIGARTALDEDTLLRWVGRVPPARFAKTLLAPHRTLVSLYDGSITLLDPEPARQLLVSDPYLERLNAPVTAAFNSYVRERLQFETPLPYLLLNEEVFESWNWRSGLQGQQGFVEAVTDLKHAMSLNPAMQVMVMHGVFDLVTPYFASAIAIRHMALDPRLQRNIDLKVYLGGHMPYLHRRTLDAMSADAATFYHVKHE